MERYLGIPFSVQVLDAMIEIVHVVMRLRTASQSVTCNSGKDRHVLLIGSQRASMVMCVGSNCPT